MKTCHIFCAGEFDTLAAPIGRQDPVLAADGGVRHCEALGVHPTGILGDFDSLGYVPEGAAVFPVEKDDTDAMLAARKALALDCRRVIFYGALDGPRLDHTIANFQTLQFLSDRGAEAYLVGKTYLVTVFQGETARFPEKAQGILSLFCMGPDARGVTLRNLYYPLQDHTLTAGHPLGVSNHFIGKPAEITVKDGSLLALWDRKNGFPERQRL